MTDIRIDQELALVIASGSPSIAVDQTLALIVEQRLVPATISTYCDQLLALLVERRGIHGVLSTNVNTVIGNGVASVIITATVTNANGVPQSGISLTLTQDGHSAINSPLQVTDVNGQASWTVTDTHAELVTFTAIGEVFNNTVAVQFTANRVDGTVYSQWGPVVAGAQIYAVQEPATTTTIPPTPLLPTFADSLGQQLIAQPIISDGLGSYAFYINSELLTLMVVNNGSNTQVYADQEAGKPSAAYHSLSWWVKATNGNAVPGAQVFILSNNYPNVPTTLGRGMPNPQVQVFSDPNGLFPIPQALLTDSFGYVNCYAPAGVYTIAVYLGGSLQQIYPDQSAAGIYAGINGRFDGWVRNALGVAQPNSRVIVSAQPCSIPGALVPAFPNNLAGIFADANGHVPIAQSLTYDSLGNPVIASIVADAFGHFSFYAQPNIALTIATYNQSGKVIQQFPDKVL